MTVNLRTKLSISYVLVAIISVLLIMVLANIFLDKHFRDYVKHNQEQKNREIITAISTQYQSNDKWNMEAIEAVGVNALENGLIIKVKDISGKVLWDATDHNNGMCQRIIEQMAHNVSSRYPYIKGDYTEVPYPIKYEYNQVGVVEIGSYGPYYLSNHDLLFINSLNKLMIGVGVFSLFFALVIGSIMARRLSLPIAKVTEASQAIANGYYSERIESESSTSEINRLTSSINHLAESLEKQELLRKRLTADVAHELRTPIATLQSHMEAMIDGIWKPDTERLKSCHEEIVRIGRMVGGLEKLSRYESENLVLEKVSFDVTDLVKALINNFESNFLAKGIKINFSGSTQIILADRDKISQVVVNLLSNALKYTLEGGEVKVSVKGTEDTTKIIVSDNGTGIPEEDIPNIFERFYRADKSRNRLTGGAGIGLTISKAIIVAHGGTIAVNSSRETGSEFVVTLPK